MHKYAAPNSQYITGTQPINPLLKINACNTYSFFVSYICPRLQASPSSSSLSSTHSAPSQMTNSAPPGFRGEPFRPRDRQVDVHCCLTLTPPSLSRLSVSSRQIPPQPRDADAAAAAPRQAEQRHVHQRQRRPGTGGYTICTLRFRGQRDHRDRLA